MDRNMTTNRLVFSYVGIAGREEEKAVLAEETVVPVA